jgi:cyclohexanecarboxyl-CoA dehydrogenase
MAKWLGPKTSAEAIKACIILHGHYGYNLDSRLDQCWRAVVSFEIGE